MLLQFRLDKVNYEELCEDICSGFFCETRKSIIHLNYILHAWLTINSVITVAIVVPRIHNTHTADVRICMHWQKCVLRVYG